jgi:hypothetical protein
VVRAAASQDIVGGVYLGFDQPRSLGGYAQGGSLAAPIFKQVVQADQGPVEPPPVRGAGRDSHGPDRPGERQARA